VVISENTFNFKSFKRFSRKVKLLLLIY